MRRILLLIFATLLFQPAFCAVGDILTKWISSDGTVYDECAEGRIEMKFEVLSDVEGDRTCKVGTSQTNPRAISNEITGNVIIPSIVDGYIVSIIGERAFWYSQAENFTLPNSIDTIGSRAFEYCSKIETFRVPNSVVFINYYAFGYCSALVSVDLGNGLTSIANEAFFCCKKLNSISFPETLLSIGHDAFYGCESLESLYIPANLQNLNSRAFYNCSNVTSIVVDSNNIVYDSRNNCNAIIETATNTLIKGCANTIIPNSISVIGNDAFYKCTSLTAITIPNGVSSIGDGAFFGCSNISSMYIPNSVQEIGPWAFRDCSKLKTINIPDGITTIKNWTFAKCPISSIAFPSSVTTIEESAFYNCYMMDNVTIEKNIKTIEDGAFYACGLTTINILAEEISIGSNVFSSCNTTNVYCYTEADKIEWNGNFGFKSTTRFHVPDKEAYEAKFPDAGVIFDNGLYNVSTNGVKYQILSIKDKTAQVIAGDNKYSGDVEILSSIEYNDVSFSVIRIDNKAFRDCSNLTSIIIPNSVKTIGEYAFSYCKSLTSLTIPNSVVTIEDYAFDGCEGIKSLTIPNSVKTIGEYAFSFCKSLTSLTIPNSVTTIGNAAFSHCYGLETLTIPNSVVTIEDDAFNGCYKLSSLFIPSSVKSIGKSAFDGGGLSSIIVDNDNEIYDSRNNCNAIIETSSNTLIVGCNYTVIPESVVNIGDNAFSSYEGSVIDIPNSVVSIGINNFQNSQWYKDQPDGLVYAGKVLYRYKGGMPENTHIILKDDTKGIADMAFSYRDCPNMTSIEMPNTLEVIGNYAFEGCEGLTSITIPNSVTSIGRRAFDGCTGLTSVVIPSSIKTIDVAAFRDCVSLVSITIPNSVETIGEHAFYSCSALDTVTIGSSVKYIGEKAFYECSSIKEVRCLADATALTWTSPDYDFEWDIDCFVSNKSGYITKFPNARVKFVGGDGDVFKSGIIKYKIISEIDKTVKISGVENRDLLIGDVEIPTSVDKGVIYNVVSIGEWAFQNCKKLTSVILPNTVKTIEQYAFSLCSGLTSISVPNSVTIIDDYTFWECSSLTSIEIPNGVLSIGEGAFLRCEKLTSVILPNTVKIIKQRAFCDSGLTSITIPNSVTSIGNRAFEDCSGLTSITIPNSVTSIGEWAFYGCSGLLSIVVDGQNTVYDSRYNCNAIIETATNTLILGCSKTIIPDDVVTIGDGAFEDCSGLTSITIPNSVTSIEDSAFRGCSELTSIIIPNSITSIGRFSFWGCNNLVSVTISNGVVSIGYRAFEDCGRLTAVIVKQKNPISIVGVFSNSANATLIVPSGSKASYEAADYWKEFKRIVEGDAIIVTANDKTRIYGDANPEFDYIVEGTELSGLPVISCSATETSAVGAYDITITDGGVTNENAVLINGKLTITKAPLTITAKSYTIRRGKSLPEFLVDYEGLKNNETDDVLITSPTITCTATSSSMPGEYDIVVSNAEAQNYEINYVAGKLTILEPLLGDANNDDIIDATDVVASVNFILGSPSESFEFLLADVNEDEEVDVFDVTKVIAMILSSPSQSRTRGEGIPEYDNITFEKITLTSDANSVYLDVNNAERFTAFQFDMSLPDGTELSDVMVAEGMANHQVQFIKIGENQYRVIGLSWNNSLLPAYNSKLIGVKLAGLAKGEMYFGNILFITDKEKKVYFMDETLRASENEDDETIYDLNGRKLNRQRENLGKGVYIINNKKVIVK